MGIQNTALSRWIREDKVPAERVIEIARHYGASVAEGLVAAGHVTQEDLETAHLTLDLTETPSHLMLEELLRRATAERQATQSFAAMPPKAVEEVVKKIVLEVIAEETPK